MMFKHKVQHLQRLVFRYKKINLFKIDPVRIVGMRACMCVCVCVRARDY